MRLLSTRRVSLCRLAGFVGAALVAFACAGPVSVLAQELELSPESDLRLEQHDGSLSIADPATSDEAASANALSRSASYGTFTYPVQGTVKYDYAWKVLDLVNARRKEAGLPTLSMDRDLLNAAVQRSGEIFFYFDHTRPDGTQCFTASDKMFAENIAYGATTPDMVMDGWMNSDGHRANILGKNYTSVGIACFQGSDGYLYWVQCFGNNSAASVSKPANANKTIYIDVAPDFFGMEYEILPVNSDATTTVGEPSKIQTGGTQRYALCVTDGYGTAISLGSAQVSWSSDNSAVATVNSEGVVTFKKTGSATITAKTTGGLSASHKVSITILDPGDVPVYRVYNPNSGLHHYTTSAVERADLIRRGWNDEGISFYVSEREGDPVYRAYNPNDGTHNWTLSEYEHTYIVKKGWDDEGIAWYIPDDATENVYRLYNPNSGEHVYTTSKYEYDQVVKKGWHGEGVAWKSL